jgi:hypothetical protein
MMLEVVLLVYELTTSAERASEKNPRDVQLPPDQIDCFTFQLTVMIVGLLRLVLPRKSKA